MDDLVKRNNLYYKKFTDVPFTGEISGKRNGKFKKGKKDGLWEWFNEDGSLKKTETWKNGINKILWFVFTAIIGLVIKVLWNV